LLKVDESQINLKGKTTEQSFTVNGITAYSVVLLKKYIEAL